MFAGFKIAMIEVHDTKHPIKNRFVENFPEVVRYLLFLFHTLTYNKVILYESTEDHHFLKKNECLM